MSVVVEKVKALGSKIVRQEMVIAASVGTALIGEAISIAFAHGLSWKALLGLLPIAARQFVSSQKTVEAEVDAAFDEGAAAAKAQLMRAAALAEQRIAAAAEAAAKKVGG